MAEGIATTGVLHFKREYTSKETESSLLNSPSICRVMRSVARELKKPFVVAQETVYCPYEHDPLSNKYKRNRAEMHRYCSLKVPRQKRTEKMVAALLLVSTPVQFNERRDSPVTHVPPGSVWTFCFEGDEGVEHFEHFLAQARTGAFL